MLIWDSARLEEFALVKMVVGSESEWTLEDKRAIAWVEYFGSDMKWTVQMHILNDYFMNVEQPLGILASV